MLIDGFSLSYWVRHVCQSHQLHIFYVDHWNVFLFLMEHYSWHKLIVIGGTCKRSSGSIARTLGPSNGGWGVWRLNKIFGGQFFLAQILILWICVVRFYVITLSIWPSEGRIVTRRIGNPFLENNIHIQVHIWNWKHPRSSHRDHLCLSFMFGGISEL